MAEPSYLPKRSDCDNAAVPYRFINRIRLSPKTPVMSELAGIRAYGMAIHDGCQISFSPNGPGFGTAPGVTHDLTMQGGDFPTPEDALESGQRWRDHAITGFACSGVGIEIGSDDNAWDVSLDSQRWVHIKEPGLLVRNSATQDFTIMALGWQPRRPVDPVANLDIVLNRGPVKVSESDYTLTERQRLSYALLHFSFFEFSETARYVTLVTAAEALIDRDKRPDEVIEQLNQFAMQVADGQLSEDAKQVLRNA